ncbi:MAG TPA: hypothetical protein EYN41_06995, partial [Flavobacteriales bacterium]|nr:hypothetical protein [Flavobacteriales bacterium]
MFYLKPLFLSVIGSVIGITAYCQALQWSSFVDSITTFSSPRPVQLTSDSVLDFVIGGGLDSTISNYGIMAFDGANGNMLWNVQTRDEIFASAVFNDITGDAVPDVYIGGRSAELRAINGADGTVIWEFFP